MLVIHNTLQREPYRPPRRSRRHGDSGTRFSLTYFAGPSAAPAAAAGAAAGAAGAEADAAGSAAQPSATSGPGGA